MRKIYFFLSVIGLISTIYSLATTNYISDFSDILVIALQGVLLIICLVGIFFNYESVYNKLRKLRVFRIRKNA